MQYNGVEISAAQEKAELFNNYFNSVFKRDDCIPLHEDYFFSDFDNDNQSLSNYHLTIYGQGISESAEHCQILWTR